MKKNIIVFVVALSVYMAASLVNASETNDFVGINCVPGATDTCFYPSSDNVSYYNSCSTDKELICPLDLTNIYASGSDVIDSVTLVMNATSGSSCSLIREYNGSTSSYTPNTTETKYFSWTTDRSILGLEGIVYNFSIRCMVDAYNKVSSYRTVVK